jgi:nucleoside-diphosphate-sugar epimerase
LVFAAGIDERVPGPAPIYEMYKKFNITALERLIKLSKEVGVKSVVVCGSYFSYFAKIMPKEKLTKFHSYIRSRIDQEKMCLSYADDNFNVAIIEIPYVFGTQKGRAPTWTFLVEQLAGMKKATMYPKGGTAMVTVKQVGQAIAGAVEKNKGGKCYPLGYYNMTWREMLSIFHKYMGTPDKKIITIPNWVIALNGIQTMKKIKAQGHESGLHPVKYAKIQCSELFIDKKLGCDLLGVEPDDIDHAIGDSIKLCLDILDGKVETIGMKAE